jgi:Uma2 family endonuclease
MTRAQFLDWVQSQEGHWEFDGFDPVPKFGTGPTAMTGGTLDHDQIGQTIAVALRTRLAGGPCRVRGPNAGLAVGANSVRYPDALVTCTPAPGTARLAPDPVIVFEVVSPGSERMDRIVKLREYQRVGSIRRFVIVESTSAALTVHARADGDGPWTTTVLTGEEVLALPEIGVEVPVAALFEGVVFEDPAAGPAAR